MILLLHRVLFLLPVKTPPVVWCFICPLPSETGGRRWTHRVSNKKCEHAPRVTEEIHAREKASHPRTHSQRKIKISFYALESKVDVLNLLNLLIRILLRNIYEFIYELILKKFRWRSFMIESATVPVGVEGKGTEKKTVCSVTGSVQIAFL